MISCQYRIFHCGDRTVVHNETFSTGKTYDFPRETRIIRQKLFHCFDRQICSVSLHCRLPFEIFMLVFYILLCFIMAASYLLQLLLWYIIVRACCWESVLWLTINQNERKLFSNMFHCRQQDHYCKHILNTKLVWFYCYHNSVITESLLKYVHL